MTAEQIIQHIEKFNSIYLDGNEVNPIPDGVKVTVWCSDGDGNEGFAENVTSDDLGIDILIARSWILQEDLIKLTTKR